MCITGRTPIHLAALVAIWLQRSPLVILSANLISSFWKTTAIRMITSAAAFQAAGTHAVTGASTSIAPVSPSRNPSKTATGEDFVWVFLTAGGKSESYKVEGLPAGLTFQEANGIGSIQGAPTQHGDYTVRITGWERRNFRGGSTETYNLRLNVRPEEGYGTYVKWTADRNVPASATDPDADPDHDGSSNLLEYAFDVDPLRPNILQGPKEDVSPVSGLEVVRHTRTQIQVAYLRRREEAGSEVTYHLEKSTDLKEWTPVGGQSWVNELNADWEGILTEITDVASVRYLRLRIEMLNNR